jgi:uncharacterized protein YggE
MLRLELGLIGCLLILASTAYAGGMGTPSLMVMGEGSVSVTADIVTVAIEASSVEANYTNAKSENEAKLNDTVDAIMNAGISGLEVLPGYSSGIASGQFFTRSCRTVGNNTTCDTIQSNSSRITSTAVMVRMKPADRSKIDKVINLARDHGTTASIQGYGLTDATSAKSAARKKAIENARASALEMANAAGASLGEVIEIQDYSYPEADMFGILTNQGGSYPPKIDVSAFVMVTYELK